MAAARGGWRRLFLLAAALLGFLHESSMFEVKDEGSGKICILANFSVKFMVDYSTQSKQQNNSFALPSDAKVHKNSTCGKGNETSPVLAIEFGKGNVLSMTFEKNKELYHVNKLMFSYNLTDATYFPNSTGGIKEGATETDIEAGLNTMYTCYSNNRINMKNVTITFSNVTLEAYLPKNTFSKNKTICEEDQGPSTIAPTTTAHTTSRIPPIPPQNPAVGRYNMTGKYGTCLLLSVGLQLNVTYTTKNKTLKSNVLNFPSNPLYSGSCDNSSVTLNLTFDTTSLSFNFAQNATTEQYFLQGITVSTKLSSEAAVPDFKAQNFSLNELKATVGKSYKCLAEESIRVENASVNLFSIQVQAFKIEGDKFGAVEECQLDENNMLIPIIVGAALAGLVLIVLIAYLIGRKRSHAGYQTI